MVPATGQPKPDPLPHEIRWTISRQIFQYESHRLAGIVGPSLPRRRQRTWTTTVTPSITANWQMALRILKVHGDGQFHPGVGWLTTLWTRIWRVAEAVRDASVMAVVAKATPPWPLDQPPRPEVAVDDLTHQPIWMIQDLMIQVLARISRQRTISILTNHGVVADVAPAVDPDNHRVSRRKMTIATQTIVLQGSDLREEADDDTRRPPIDWRLIPKAELSVASQGLPRVPIVTTIDSGPPGSQRSRRLLGLGLLQRLRKCRRRKTSWIVGHAWLIAAPGRCHPLRDRTVGRRDRQWQDTPQNGKSWFRWLKTMTNPMS